MCPPTMTKAAMTAQERKYRAEDDCRTLERAEEIRGDQSRMGAARKHATDQARRMQKIARSGRGRSRRR